jgi:hypothetical protein
MPVLVQVESRASLWLPLADGHHHRAAFPTQAVAPPVAGLHCIFQEMSHHILPQMPGEVLRAPVPEANQPIPVHDVNPHRQLFHQMPEQLRVIEKVGRHGWTRHLLVLSAVKSVNFRRQKDSKAVRIERRTCPSHLFVG